MKYGFILTGAATDIVEMAQEAEEAGYIEAGATWWLESIWDGMPQAIHRRVRSGPPRVL